MKRLTRFFAILIAAGCLATCAFADFIVIDENGNGIGTKGQGYLANDPGPGGLKMVLTYNLPFFVHPGDVLLYDPNGGVQDIIRFNKHRVVFYSDNIDGFDSLADTSGPPTKLRKTRIFLPELGTENFNGAFYTPLMGQPGYNALYAPSYLFISDFSAVPEPSALILLGSGAMLLCGLQLRQRRTSRSV